MSVLGDEFRANAHAQSAAADAIFKAEDFDTNPTKQATAIIGKVNSTLYSVAARLAEQRDFPEVNKKTSLLEKRLAILKQNDAVRQAAATGDWEAFDKLVAAMGEVKDANGQPDAGSATA